MFNDEEVIKKNNEILDRVKELTEENLKMIERKTQMDARIILNNLEVKRLNLSLRPIVRRVSIRLTKEQKEEIFNRRGRKCESCNKTEEELEKEKKFLSIHHKVPLSKGGTNEDYNLEVDCNECHKKYHPFDRVFTEPTINSTANSR